MASSSGPLPAPLNADLSAFESHPLFMRSLPEEYAEDAALSALQNLAHAGTPDEIAQNFKEQGNEYFKGKRFREAEGFYTQGINSNPSDTHLREALLNNRAACNLEMKNYGRALRDCSLALTLNKYSSKAYYRSAFALLALNRLEEALDCCHRCLTFDIDNTAVKALKVQVSTAKEEKVRTETLEFNRKRKEAEKRRLIKEALDKRHILHISTPRRATVADNQFGPHLADGEPGTLIFSVACHYPQHSITEFIAHFHEHDRFADHLDNMLPPNAAPPEWDKEQNYINDGRLVVYASTRRKRLLKVGKRMTLKDLIQAAKGKAVADLEEEKDGLEMRDGTLDVIILVKGSIENEWVAGFKKDLDREG